MNEIKPEDSVYVSAKIPTRLVSVINEKVRIEGLIFSELLGQLILVGLERTREQEEK